MDVQIIESRDFDQPVDIRPGFPASDSRTDAAPRFIQAVEEIRNIILQAVRRVYQTRGRFHRFGFVFDGQVIRPEDLYDGLDHLSLFGFIPG